MAARGDGFIEIALANPLRPGDRIELRARGLRCERLTVDEIRGPDGALLVYGRSPSTIRVHCAATAEPGALVRIARP